MNAIFKQFLNMKIALNQPNGFPTVYNNDPNKFIDAIPNKELKKQQFSPYEDNAGTVVAVAGEDFVVVGGDTRLSQGYSIITRGQSKLQQMTKNTILASSGMHVDFCELKKFLKAKLQIYDYKIERQPTTQSFANLLSKTLYSRRFFPYYTFNIVAGLDKNGKGIIYGYDAIGSCNIYSALSQGSGSHMILPFLDAEIVGYHNPNHSKKPKLTPQTGVQLIEQAFKAAAERDIYTGDKLEILVLTKDGCKRIWKQLRKD